ncbi:antirestriction protein ArdA [Nakamurella multipartita]|uniref:Antirestriction ArdA family protein n=1 Tax=Nakamurella multipartita (strain ATCC 700099 / DSM 44233 / CIP 104796 / JCM 9543 / NBRC 105858 / Y-104) TaxID=479431 RepID=C8X7R1_NAKMY|nr:antirestriction protein ArdA [Nakamurella multipartita]ACV80914.1 Antirestriction ArdA family protein [Nakamurella multipartita DSM 44233]
MEQQPHSENEQSEGDEPDRAGSMVGDADVATPTAVEQSIGAAAEADSPTETVEAERRPPEPPSVYVASLADFNVGKRHGTWVDMTMPLEDIELAIRQMLERSPVLQAEGEDYGDWAIHDSEHFGVVTVHEHDDLDMLHDLAEGIAEHGEAFSSWAEAFEGEPDRWPLFTEAYLGEYDSLTAYGEHLWAEMGWQQVVDDVLPPEVARYTTVDAEQLAQDLWLEGSIQLMQKPGGGCWIFRGDV